MAEDGNGQQYAAVFRSSGDFETVKLPVAYERIVSRLKALGYPIREIGNLHLFESNKRLVWSFSEAETQVYMALDGTVLRNPFQQQSGESK